MYRLFLLAVMATLTLAACQQSETPATAKPAEVTADTSQPAANDWDAFVEQKIEEHVQAHPAWAVVQGRHEFDGQLPDWSAEAIHAEINRMHAVRDEAMAFDEAGLTSEQQYQREYLVSRLDHDLFWMEKARWPFRNPMHYIGWMGDSLDPGPYITLDYAPIEERMQAFTRYLEAIPEAAEQIQANLEMPMPLTWLQLGVDAFGGYASYFRDEVPAVWASVDDEKLQAEFAAANEKAVAAMQALTDWLESNRGTATDDYALGPELYLQMLWDTERVNISLQELESIALADMARNTQALRDACAEFAPGEDIRSCFARMADRKPEGSPVEAAREQLVEIRKFMVEQDLATIPGTEEALVNESPPYNRSNFAYISIPGPWEKNQPSVYYISPPNPAWPEDVQRDYIAGESDLLFTSVHEVWPGHFLNFLHANRAPFFYGRVFVGYAFAEGWAHYTEEMMLEAGLRGADPETRIGQISNALLRNARFLSTIGLHTKGWSVEQSKQFFMQEGFQSEGTAIQQAARGTYDPAYLNYTMGKLLIKQLRDDWSATRGGRSAWREFHDTFLSYGGPPIPLVRQQMMNEPEPKAVFPVPAMEANPASINGSDSAAQSWICTNGQTVTTQFVGDNLAIVIDGDPLELERARSASGAKYEAEGTSFWTKGATARLESEAGEAVCSVAG